MGLQLLLSAAVAQIGVMGSISCGGMQPAASTVVDAAQGTAVAVVLSFTLLGHVPCLYSWRAERLNGGGGGGSTLRRQLDAFCSAQHFGTRCCRRRTPVYLTRL